MITIVQISDFHIKTSMGKPEDNFVFTSMISAFKQQFKKEAKDKIIVVYNGDIIDNTNIFEQIQASSKYKSASQKATFWEKKAAEEYELAIEYFTYIKREICDDRIENIIICCGNHDVNTWYDHDLQKIDCPYGHEYTFAAKRFNQYEKFLNKLCVPMSRRAQTFFASVEGFNFLVANTNWLNKFMYPSSLCVDCKSIKEKIQAYKSSLWKNLRNNKYKNIFVSHAPFSDFCEEAKYGYEKNKYCPITDSITDNFGLHLFGDKHTGHAKGTEYIVGAPLDSEKITCVAHEFSSDGSSYYYRTLTYDDNHKWEVTNTYQYIEEILRISDPYIKEKAKEYLFQDKYPDTRTALQNFELIRASAHWSAASQLFRASSRIRQPKDEKYSTPIPVISDYTSTLIRLISSSTQRISIAVRGGTRLGKSVCMSVLYMNMLHRFACGTFEYIPVYINIEKILQDINTSNENRDSEEYYNKVIEKVSSILQSGRKCCESYQHDACCIIDGLNKYRFYRKARIDDGIMALLDRKENECYKHLVTCIDTDNSSTEMVLNYTEPHKTKNAQYVIYFDPILTYKIHAKERYNSFIEAYCKLKDVPEKTADVIRSNVARMQILELDTNLLTFCWDKLQKTNSTDTSFSLLTDIAQNKVSGIQMTNEIAKANYLLHVESKDYSEIKKHCSIDNNEFDLIRTQPLITKYLLAKYYVDTISNYTHGNPIDPCINQLLNHEICSLARAYIKYTHSDDAIRIFAENEYNALKPCGQATLTYLVGRLQTDRDKIKKILDEQEKEQIENEKRKKDAGIPIDYYERIAKRSVAISQIFNSSSHNEQQNKVLDYVQHLISNENDRRINRQFHLIFYGDRSNELKTLEEEKIYEGFDMYCTYQILGKRVDNQINNPREHRLLSLELFTLCDLIQTRIDTPVAYKRIVQESDSPENQEVASFFYNRKYNAPDDSMAYSIITYMNKLVSRYLNEFRIEHNNHQFNEYLQHQKEIYERILPILEKGPLNADSDCYHPEAFLEELVKLETTKRMGWMFPKYHRTVKKKTFQNKRDSDIYYETTLQHVYETYLMGLLYLPEESSSKNYNKKTILEMILIHDLGEAHTGDSIKSYEFHESVKQKETDWCRNLYLQGVHENIADLTYYGKLWKDWCGNDSSNYNVLVAKDMDRLQLLYKLLQLLTQEDKTMAIKFEKKRFEDFWELRKGIVTKEVLNIYNILIGRNKKYIDAVKNKYSIDVTETH